MGRLFRAHGEFCASHPWEVIVALITFTACMFSVDKGSSSAHSDPLMTNEPTNKPLCHGWRESCDGFEAQYIAADVILMTIVRLFAILYCCYQFCNLHKLGSKYILGECRWSKIYYEVQPMNVHAVNAVNTNFHFFIAFSKENVLSQLMSLIDAFRFSPESWK